METRQEAEFPSSSKDELGAHAADFDFLGGCGGMGWAGEEGGFELWSRKLLLPNAN